MTTIVQTLVPIVLLVATGAVLLRAGFFDDMFRRGLDRLVYWVALPALIVGSVAAAPSIAGLGLMIGLFLGATAMTAAGAFVVAKGLRLEAMAVPVFVQAGFRGNLAFVGLPVIVLVASGREAMVSTAVMVFAPAVIFYNLLAVAGLSLARHRFDGRALLRAGGAMAVNPLLLACALGLVLGRWSVPVPGPVGEAMRLMGQTAGPLALLSLGGAVVVHPVRRYMTAALLAAGMKLVVLPAVVLGLALVAGLGPEQRTVLLVLAATPTAVASYVLAAQMHGDAGLAAAAVVLSTLLCPLALAVVLALS